MQEDEECDVTRDKGSALFSGELVGGEWGVQTTVLMGGEGHTCKKDEGSVLRRLAV